MKKHIYYISDAVEINSATTNRIISLAKGLVDNGFKVSLVFINIDHYDGLMKDTDIDYIFFNTAYCNCKLIRYILKCKQLAHFIKSIDEECSIIVNGCPFFLKLIHSNCTCRLYLEVSEHPYVNCNAIRKILIDHFYLKYVNRADGIFTISYSLKQAYIDICKVQESKVHIINMVVDSSRFINVSKSDDCDKYIAYCGTITDGKDGVGILINAFSIIHEKHPDVKLYLIGKYHNKQIEVNHQLLIQKLNLQKSIVYTGLIPNEQMPQLLTDAIVLLLSRPNNLQAKNGFPTKLGEYLLTKNPVVVTGVGEIPLYLKHNDSALLAKPNDIYDFAEKVCWAIENPTESRKIGKAGYKVALESFNNTVEASKIRDVINANT